MRVPANLGRGQVAASATRRAGSAEVEAMQSRSVAAVPKTSQILTGVPDTTGFVSQWERPEGPRYCQDPGAGRAGVMAGN